LFVLSAFACCVDYAVYRFLRFNSCVVAHVQSESFHYCHKVTDCSDNGNRKTKGSSGRWNWSYWVRCV